MLSYIYYYRLYAHVIFFILYHYISYITHTNIPLRRSYPFSYKNIRVGLCFPNPTNRCEPCHRAGAPLRIRNLVPALEKARAYRGRGGEVIRQAACRDLGCGDFGTGVPHGEFKAGPTLKLRYC